MSVGVCLEMVWDNGVGLGLWGCRGGGEQGRAGPGDCTRHFKSIGCTGPHVRLRMAFVKFSRKSVDLCCCCLVSAAGNPPPRHHQLHQHRPPPALTPTRALCAHALPSAPTAGDHAASCGNYCCSYSSRPEDPEDEGLDDQQNHRIQRHIPTVAFGSLERTHYRPSSRTDAHVRCRLVISLTGPAPSPPGATCSTLLAPQPKLTLPLEHFLTRPPAPAQVKKKGPRADLSTSTSTGTRAGTSGKRKQKYKHRHSTSMSTRTSARTRTLVRLLALVLALVLVLVCHKTLTLCP